MLHKNKNKAVYSDGRSSEVDFIRMAALIGICIVNVPFMALPVESVFVPPEGYYNSIAAFLVECFFQLKFFILFSFVFGWGIAIQSKSACSKGKSFSRLYFRRMTGLAIFGVVHAIFVFNGDILLLYSLLGLIIWRIKDFSPRQLMRFAACMIPLSMAMLTIIAVLIDSTITNEAISQIKFAGDNLGGGFLEATGARLSNWPITLIFLFFLQGPLALSAFSAGLAAAKTDFFSEGSEGFNLIQRNLPLLIAIALPLNILYAAVVSAIVPGTYEVLSLVGFVLIAVGAPALSAIYLYLLIRISRMIQTPRLLILAGRNSLSSYVTQEVVSGFIFGAYGLGLFYSLDYAALVPTSLVIALIAMILVGMFANIFGRGPLEPILRRISQS